MEIIDFSFFVNFFPSFLRVHSVFFAGRVEDDSKALSGKKAKEMIFIGTPTEQCGLFILMTQF